MRIAIITSLLLLAACATVGPVADEYAKEQMDEATKIADQIRISGPVEVNGETLTPDQARERIAGALRLGSHTVRAQGKVIKNQDRKIEKKTRERLNVEADAGFGRYVKRWLFWGAALAVALSVGAFLLNKYVPSLTWPTRKK
jgi:hypothetical protein